MSLKQLCRFYSSSDLYLSWQRQPNSSVATALQAPYRIAFDLWSVMLKASISPSMRVATARITPWRVWLAQWSTRPCIGILLLKALNLSHLLSVASASLVNQVEHGLNFKLLYLFFCTHSSQITFCHIRFQSPCAAVVRFCLRPVLDDYQSKSSGLTHPLSHRKTLRWWD